MARISVCLPVSYTHLDVYKRQVLLLILGVLVAIQGVQKLFEKNDEKQTA